jgi:ribonuclease BN (tRNA processing enzyme)
MVRVATELVLLGTAGAPLPVAGRAGISSALVVDGRVFVIDCGRGTPSGFADAGLDFARLDGVFLSHLHADHTGDLAGLLLYPWEVRVRPDGPAPPVRVYGPGRPAQVPAGDADFRRQTTICPELPAPGTTDLVGHILAGYAYHLNVMPLDAAMPDAGQLVRATDIAVPARVPGQPQVPAVVLDGRGVRVRTVAVTHGHAAAALAYRFDTADGSVVFSGGTTVNDDLIALAQGPTSWCTMWPTSATWSSTAGPARRWTGWPGCTPMSPRSAGWPSGPGSASSSSATTCLPNPARSASRTGPSGPGYGSAAAQPRAGTGCAGRCPARRDGDGGRWPDPDRGEPDQRHGGAGRGDHRARTHQRHRIALYDAPVLDHAPLTAWPVWLRDRGRHRTSPWT